MNLGYWLSSEEHAPRDLVAHAVRAERTGFTTAMISDHYHPWVRAQGQSPFVWSVLGAIAWYPVLYSLSLGQPVVLVMLGVIVCWRLAESGKPYLAGAALGLSVLKPQVESKTGGKAQKKAPEHAGSRTAGS